jgi:hypothetical protein
MVTYAVAEGILARLHGVDAEAQRGAFRGRLKHLKRLGIPLDSSPGKGKKIKYSIEQLYQWAFCLELEEFGLDPALISALVRRYWDDPLHGIFKQAAIEPSRVRFCYVLPGFMAKSWKLENQQLTPYPTVGYFLAAAGVEFLQKLSGEKTVGRAAVFDLTRLVGQISDAMKIEQRDLDISKMEGSK